MNVYEYAMKVEKDGEAYYRELASKSPNNGLKRIFTMLAEEEIKHYNVFKNMMKKNDIDLDKLDIITDTKTIFETLLNEKDNINFSDEQIAYYKEAIKKEENSEQFYLDKSKELENENEKAIFIKIAAEEVKHKKVLEEIVLFIQEPDNWVASAEF
ncbi:MAG: ferritin-like domain-containing protein [Halarcobacter sp.]